MNRSALALKPATRPSPSVVMELLKPITWFPPMWAFGCGIVSSGVDTSGRWLEILLGVALAGPLVCATSQAVNDWFDRHVDAINEPDRPIPSGRMPGMWGLYIAVMWTALSLLVAAALGIWVLAAAVLGIALAWAYSAPPARLKRNGWLGNTAVAACYEGLPWLTAVMIMTGTLPGAHAAWLALFYSIGAHGIMTLNDFKSVEGDQRMGIASLPVLLGVRGAGIAACLFMAMSQVCVIAALLLWGFALHASALAILLAVQVGLMLRLLDSPRERAPWYNATGVSLYVSGMMISANALRGLHQGLT